MSNSNRAPYGTWESPITAEAITGNSTSLADIVVDPITSVVYHLEGRPSEEGRTVLVDTRASRDVIGSGWNASTGVHEYGGGAAIVRDGVAYFSHYKDGRIYRVPVSGGDPEAITPENSAHRFANLTIHPKFPNLIVAILEDHTNDTPSTVVNTLCLIDTTTKTVLPTLVSGTDFYALPLFSPDGQHLAWIQWSHPDMPWEGSEVHVAGVQVNGNKVELTTNKLIAGEKGTYSAGYPLWASNDTLLFISDISGFSNPWKYSLADGTASPILPAPIKEDFCNCMWSLSMFPYALVGSGKAIFSSWRDGGNILNIIDIATGTKVELTGVYTTVESVRAVGQGGFAFIGTKANEGESVLLGNVDGNFETLKGNPTSGQFDQGIVSIPQGIPLTIPPNNELLHVVYFPPHNPNYPGGGLEGEKPPCIVSVHGGPTGMAYQSLNWKIAYYTSRGFAWLDVNYGGSFGYGSPYRDRLIGKWGIVDVEDCISAVRAMSQRGDIDPKRAVIRGGSAGGFTTLVGLCHSSDPETFAGGTSMYGISDLLALAETTHKFESQYPFKLLGGTPEEVPENYKDRSPINHVEDFNRPLLILQGELDKVVPKEQAEAIYESIKSRGGEVEYKLYEGEGHGFRQKEHQKDALERELAWYKKILKL
ncbi:hypothetical protein VNI00_012419 [Paramarasmius palmivorus]|uniref:Peptidase S9 prolyl oligopeptidase catalytic domain-containing protein n=1 Tax=Paramarasmius palmivorus TaxID=297713 RepID=A0AAW0C5W4_9AGAR